MQKRSFLRKSAVSLAATLGLGALGSDATAQITLPPNLTIGTETGTPGLLEGRVAGAFNITAPNPGDLGQKLEPIMAQTPGGNNVEPWPDNITYIYTGQFLIPDNGTAGDGLGHFAFAEHFDDSTLIRIDGVERLNNQQWDVPNTTGALTLAAGWHDIEFRFGQGTGGAGPSNSGGWNDQLGLGLDLTLPIEGDTTQANYIRPVDNGTGNLFRTVEYNVDTSRDNQNVTVNANATLTVLQSRTVPLGSLTVSNNTTFTLDTRNTTTFTQTNLPADSTFNVLDGVANTGPLRSTGAVTSLTKTGSGELNVSTAGGGNVASIGDVNVNAGTLAVAVGAMGATSIGTGTINLNGSTLALNNDLGVPGGAGLFSTVGDFYPDLDIFNSILPGLPDSANGLGWSGLDTKAQFDSKLAPLTPSATRSVVGTINFPRGNDSPADGGGNDIAEELFNVDGANLGVSLNGNQDFIARFTGKLNVTNAGATEFLLMSNDGAALFLDVDQGPGANWQKVVDNNRYTTGEGNFQGHYSGSPTGVADPALAPAAGGVNITNPAAPTLQAGVYDYIVGFYNKNANESGIELFWDQAGGADAFELVPSAVATGSVTFGNEVVVSGNSALDVRSQGATLSNLQMTPGSSLTVSGNALTTSIAATGAGTVRIGTSGPAVNLTTLDDAGAAVNFLAGPGRVTLSRVGGPGPDLGATSSVGTVAGGTLVARGDETGNTLAGTPVTLGGGTLELIANPGITKSHTGDVAFDGTFVQDVIDPGSTPGSNYLVFEDLTAADLTLLTTPLIGGTARAPVNAIELRNGSTSLAINFIDPDNTTPHDVVGPAGVSNTVTWNNLTGANGNSADLNTDVGGASNPNDTSIVWTSPNAWSSSGRGEENNTAPVGENRDLMTGYLDTGGLGGAGVRIDLDNLPGSLTAGAGYDLYVYIKGGTNGRGGDYTVGGDFPVPDFGSNVTVTENSTINVTGFTRGQVGNLSVDAGRTLNINGNGLNVDDVSAGAGGLVVFNGTQGNSVAGALGGEGTLRIPTNRTVDFTGNGAASSGSPKLDIARGGTVNFGPGTGGTFAGSAVSTIANEGLLHAANGITDLSGATMTTSNVPGLVAGLLGGRVAGATNAVDFPAGDVSSVDLALSRAQTTDNNFFGGDNGTWVYTGEIRIPDTDGDGTPGPIAFGEQFDDFTLLKIDGEVLLNNNVWNVPASSGQVERADNEPDGSGIAGDGWFSIEARFGQGGGGVGPNTDWNIGFGIDTNPADSFDAQSLPLDNPATAPSPVATPTQYTAPADDGTMNLFRTINPPLETIRVDSGATLKLGAMVGANTVNINADGRLELHGATSKMQATGLNIAGTPTAPTATLDVTDSALVLDYADAASNPTADVRARIVAARGGTDFLGTWDGKGITSSDATADPGSRGVGYANNADLPLGAYTTFRGQPVDDTSVLIRGTLNGDANLDGIVGDEDVTIIGATYGTTSGATWAMGDFTYDGAVDDADVTLLGALYDPGAPPVGGPPVAVAGAVAAVPEPATWLMLTLGGLGAGLFGWRRRKTQS